MPLVIPCPAQRWEDSLKCKGGISRVLLTFSLSLCVNLASCAAMRWTELFSSLHLASSTSQAEQKAVLIASELLRTMRSLQAGVSLYPCQWPCSQRRLRGTVCKQVPRTCALHAPAHMCALLSHLYTDGYTQTQLPGGQEFCWKFLGEMIQFLCVSTGLFTFISSYTWIPNVFLFVYSATGPFKTFFLPFQLRQACKYYFPLLHLCLLCAAVYLQKKLLMENRTMTSWPSLHLLHLHGAVTCRGQGWPQRDQEMSSTQPEKRLLLSRFGDSYSRQPHSWWEVGKQTRHGLGPINHKISWGRAVSWSATETAHQDALLLGQMSM